MSDGHPLTIGRTIPEDQSLTVDVVESPTADPHGWEALIDMLLAVPVPADAEWPVEEDERS